MCEATAEPQAYSSEDVCGSAFAFGLERAIIEALKANTPEATARSVQKVGDFFKTRPHRMATMLANHDIFAGHRIWDQLGGDEARYKLAAASYLLQPGIPGLVQTFVATPRPCYLQGNDSYLISDLDAGPSPPSCRALVGPSAGPFRGPV